MKISEKMLEDWICENPDSLLYDIEVLQRQLSLKHGILDLLGWADGFGILAIELKRGPLRERDIGQVLRYTHDINKILHDMWSELRFHGDTPDIDQSIVNHLQEIRKDAPKSFRKSIYERLLEEAPKCIPVLVGQSIDEMTFAAAEGCGAIILLWIYNEDTGEIKTRPSDLELVGEGFTEKYQKWAIGCVYKHLHRTAWMADALFNRHIAEGLFAKVR